MSKLTKSVREAMAEKLVQHRYADEGKQLATANRTLFERVYTEAYGGKMASAMKTLVECAPEALNKKNRCKVNVGGMNLMVGGDTPCRTGYVKIEQAKIEPRPMLDGYCSDAYYNGYVPTDPKLVEDLTAFATSVSNFPELIDTAYHEALAVLSTFNTGKQLAEGWPEAMPVIGHLIPEDNRTLPTVQVSAINAKFGLPPETVAA